MIKCLGQGGYGFVTSAKRVDGKERAFKFLESDSSSLLKERYWLKLNLDHPCIVKYYAKWDIDTNLLKDEWKSKLSGHKNFFPPRIEAIEMELCAGNISPNSCCKF